MTAHDIIEALPIWAVHNEDIAGVFLVGSYARGDASAESDIDFVLLTNTPEKYLCDDAWVKNFGDPKSLSREDWGKVQSLRVYYTEGLEVEYGITTPDWAIHPVPESTRKVLEGGFKLLFGKDGEFKNLSCKNTP